MRCNGGQYNIEGCHYDGGEDFGASLIRSILILLIS
jgi:hypothetical protein